MSVCRPATGERRSSEQQEHIYDDAGTTEQQTQDVIYEEFPEEKVKVSRPSGLLYEAIYDYEGQADGDLSFKAGEVIEVRILMVPTCTCTRVFQLALLPELVEGNVHVG